MAAACQHENGEISIVKFEPTIIDGAYVVHPAPKVDKRGFFARVWCEEEARKHHLLPKFKQINTSFNHAAGTLRGLHLQAAPHAETKLVRCIRGSLYDVIIDLRENSKSYRKVFSIELNQDNRLSLYIPRGCAHGFQTLEDNAELIYYVDDIYSPESETGVRWDDPSFSIAWPLPVSVISNKDQQYPDWQPPT